MVPAYSISIERSRALLRLTLSGFFDFDTVLRFEAERNRAVRKLGCGRNQHITLCDIREQKVSAIRISEEFRRVITDPQYSSRRLAFVVTHAVERISTRRVADRPNVGFFADVASAETWLFDDAATGAPADRTAMQSHT